MERSVLAKPVMELTNTWPEPQRSTARRLRELILERDRGLEEGLKWNWPTYFNESNVCSIICHKDHINLQFFRGAKLEDPEKLLEGTGKMMRHIKIHDMDEIDATVIAGYVEEAAGLS